MRYVLQGLLIITLISLGSGDASAQELGIDFKGKYKKPTVNQRLLGDNVAMVNNERNDYATNLVAYAVNTVRASKANQESLNLARNILGLALHLSPRNKKCVVVNAQLARGVLPDLVVADYKQEVFASLLLARGQLLEKNEQEINQTLARYFIALSAVIDPRNEDAVYESELRRIDHGNLAWKLFTDEK